MIHPTQTLSIQDHLLPSDRLRIASVPAFNYERQQWTQQDHAHYYDEEDETEEPAFCNTIAAHCPDFGTHYGTDAVRVARTAQRVAVDTLSTKEG